MPVRFVRKDGLGSRVVVADDPFWIGSGSDADLVIHDLRVEPRHARVRYKTGEHLLSAAEGASIWVNGEALPLMPLRDGDLVSLTPPGDAAPIELVFENRMQDVFIPPGLSFAEAWLAHPRSSEDSGPDAFGEGEILDERPTDRVRRVGDVVVKVMGPVHTAAEAERYLRLLSTLAGARNLALAPVVDGGLVRRDGQSLRWMVSRFVPGSISRAYIRSGGLDVVTVLDILTPVAFGLKHLHQRGLLHRDVAPSNVVVRRNGQGALIDFGHTVAWEEGVPPSAGVIGTPGYIAPEEVVEGGERVTPAVDIYGLSALGYALVTGSAPVSGGDVLETLGNALRRPPRPSEIGCSIPEPFEDVLMGGLVATPADRPTAREFIEACERARALLEPDKLVEGGELV